MITTWTRGADDGMPQELLVETLRLVRKHPWWHARTKLALAILREERISPPATIIDVGCGWGTNLDALEDAGYQATGLDISRRILECIDRPQRRLVEADLTNDLPSESGSFDALLALDVIEHLDDDRGAVRKFGQLLRPGAIGIISVPARPDLFSEFDAIQGHRRRYLPENLREVVLSAGLELKRLLWWGQWMVPILRHTRRKQQATDRNAAAKTYAQYLQLPPWPAPLLMKWMYAREHSPALKQKLKTGTSLFAVVQKK